MLAYLRAEGTSIIESVKVVREVEGVPLGAAKTLVDNSETWSDLRESSHTLREAAADSIDLPGPQD